MLLFLHTERQIILPTASEALLLFKSITYYYTLA